MIAKLRVRSVAGLIVLAAAVLTPERGEAQRTKTPTKKPTAPTTTVQPTASEASTAIAVRGRPPSGATVRTVERALQSLLTKPAIRNALLEEARKQLSANRPLAWVDGYWVSAVNMSPIFQLPAIRSELLASLGTNGPQLLSELTNGAGDIGIALTPGQIATLMGTVNKDFMASLGLDALESNMTDFTGLEVLLIMGGYLLVTGFFGSLWDHASNYYGWNQYNPEYSMDTDGDGTSDAWDRDDDGDGVRDKDDRYPKDKNRSICDCTRPAVSLGTTAKTDVLAQLLGALANARSARTRVLLGPAIPGQAGGVVLVF